MFVLISVLGLTQSLAEERLAGIVRRVGMLPVRKAHWLAGKLLATSLLGMVQFMVLLAFGALLGVGFGGAPGAVLLVALAYVLAATALALALAAVAHTPPQASALATFAWLILVPLGGGWWPLLFVPGWLRTLGHLSPVAWCLDAFNAVMMNGAPWQAVLVPTAVLLLFAGVFFSLGVVGFDFQQTGGEPQPAPPYFGGSREGDG
jgi:ABC-2 type transport system permease protein